jgi:hypothetical protein
VGTCDYHGTVPGSKTHSLYVTQYLDKTRYQRRLRLCSDCVRDTTGMFGGQWSDGYILVRFNPESACNSCGQIRGELGTLHPLYATGYGNKDQRYDYSATYCEACAKSVISHFRLEASPNGVDK